MVKDTENMTAQRRGLSLDGSHGKGFIVPANLKVKQLSLQLPLRLAVQQHDL